MSYWPGRTSAEMREMVIDWYFRPLARGVFARARAAESVIFAVAQYWCDEANDAVHFTFVASSSAHPEWPGCLTPAENTLAQELEGEESYWSSKLYSIAISAENQHLGASEYGASDENRGNIAAFAAFTGEFGSQDEGDEQYMPYAIARRPREPGMDIEVEIVGLLHKPHLDGVMVTDWDTYDRPDDDDGVAREEGDFPELQSSRRDVLRALERLQQAETLRGRGRRIGISFREANEELETARSLNADEPEPVAARAELRRLIAEARKSLEVER